MAQDSPPMKILESLLVIENEIAEAYYAATLPFNSVTSRNCG